MTELEGRRGLILIYLLSFFSFSSCFFSSFRVEQGD